MNFLQLKTKNRQLAKEFKANYKKSKSETKLEFMLLRSNIEDNIEVHFANNVDFSENEGNKEYECVFYVKDIYIYEIIVPYEIDRGQYFQDDKQISVTDTNGNSFSVDDKNLRIVTKNYNFNKTPISDSIEKYIESELKDLQDA